MKNHQIWKISFRVMFWSKVGNSEEEYPQFVETLKFGNSLSNASFER